MDIETRSIDFIPENERYGTANRLFSLWFSATMQVTTLAIGTLGIVGGLSFAWTAVAIVLGNAIGTTFMAAHSAQGPHLGIPQMIQSRAQFGVYGAGLPLVLVIVAYIVFTAANAVMMRGSINAFVHVGDDGAIVLFGIVTLIIGFVGYELIHRLGQYLTLMSTILFTAAGFLIVHHSLGTVTMSLQATSFKSAAFLLVFAQAVSWTLGFAPVVADYSRYLPSNCSTKRTFVYTYFGTLIGSTFIMLVGALLATFAVNPNVDPGGAIATLFGPYAALAYLVTVTGVVQLNVLNVYSAYMSVATIATGFSGMVHVSRGQKLAIMFVVTAIATVIAMAAQHNFNAYFADILNGQLYVLVPWSSINLVDYYAVRRGRYSIDAIFDKNGIYGRYNVKTIFVYVLALLVEIPFADLSFYRGPIARAISADITWIPALIVPGVCYYLLHRWDPELILGMGDVADLRTLPVPRVPK